MKKHWIRNALFLGALVTGIRCQYPADGYTQPDKKTFLVINGELTGSYGKVTVENSVQEIGSYNNYATPPAVASVIYVTDSKGQKFTFKSGVKDSSFHAVTGETYQLFVQANGKMYQSTPEKVPVCPDIDSVAFRFNVNSDLVAANPLRNGFDVSARGKDDPGTENFYQWDWIHYIKVLYCATVKGSNPPQGLYCDGNCWDITKNPSIIVSSDALINGKNFDIPIVRVPFLEPPNRYYLRVEQRAITKNTFIYFESLKTQTQSNGTLFDVPSQTVFNPNVHSVSDPTEAVLGVFNVFASKVKIIYIDMTVDEPGGMRTIIPETLLQPFPLAPNAPCVEGPGRTKIKPEGWVD